MTLKAMFILVLSLALLPKGRHIESEYDINHIQTAKDCPPYDSHRYHVLARKLGCNDDKPMHCAQLLGSKEFTVRCLKPKNCTQGQQPFIQDRSDTVSCGFCYGDTYNSVPSQPSYSYSECTPMTKLDSGRIPCEHLELRTSDPDFHKYNRYIRCNILEGYILDDQSVSDPSRDRLGYCTNATDPRCIKYSCVDGLELIKNYSCVKNCSSEEYRAGDQTCVKRQTGQTPGPLTSLGPSTTPGSPVVTIDSSSTRPVTQTTEPMKSESTDNSKTIIITFGVAVMSVVAAFLFYGWKRGFPHGRQPSVDHSLHEVHSEPTNNDQPNTITDDSEDRAESSPLLSEVQSEHAAQPNQEEEAKNQYIGTQEIHIYISHGKERVKTKAEKASEEKSVRDGDRSWYKHPHPETGADDQRSNPPNTDIGVSQDPLDKHPHPETGADDQPSQPPNTDISVSQDSLDKYPHPDTGADDQRSHPPNTDIGVSQDTLETGADDQPSQPPNTDIGVSQDSLDKHPHPETGADDQPSHPPNTDIGVSQDTIGSICAGQSAEVTATKSSMATLEDEKHNSDGDSENDDKSNAGNNENYAADNDEKGPFIPAGSMPL